MKNTVLALLLAWAVTACVDKAGKAREHISAGNQKARELDYDGAIGEYTRAITLDPTLAEAYFLRGNIKFTKKDVDGAIADYNEAVRLKPDYADAYNNRGDAYFYKGDRAAACLDWLKAQQLGRKNMRDKTKGCDYHLREQPDSQALY